MPLQAGTGVREITPQKPLQLCGYPHVKRISTGVHDPLLATALCLRTDAEAVLLVALDIVGLHTTMALELRKTLAEAAGLDEAQVFVSCTHTHSGPITYDAVGREDDPARNGPDPEFLDRLTAQVRAAAEEATGALRPAELAWTAASGKGVGGNRHDPEGPADPEVGLLVVRDPESRRPRAVSMTYSMHPTVLHEDSTLVTSDFPHYARARVREGLDAADLPVLYHMGPSGNQSPRWFVQGQTFAEAERLGGKLGQAAVDGLRALADDAFQAGPVLGGAVVPVELVPRRMPPVAEAEKNLREVVAEYERLKAEGAGHGPVRTAECATFGAERTLSLARAQEDGRLAEAIRVHNPAQVQGLRVGEACLVGLPCEIFVEYGLAIKERAAGRAFVVSLVNGESQGYIVTPDAQGYEAMTCLFDAASGPRLVDAAVRAVDRLAAAD